MVIHYENITGMSRRDHNNESEDRGSQTEAVCILIFLLGLAVLVIGMNFSRKSWSMKRSIETSPIDICNRYKILQKGILPGLIMMFLEDF